jgi:hypothetical protein
MITQNIYLKFDHKAIVATLGLLKYYKRFLASDCIEAQCPISGYGFYITKPEAEQKLIWLIQMAINRKAGIPDQFGKRDDIDYVGKLRRDQIALQNIRRRIRVYQFETKEVRSRFSHLLSSCDDY